MTYPNLKFRRSRWHLYHAVDYYVKQALDQPPEERISSKYVYIELLASKNKRTQSIER